MTKAWELDLKASDKLVLLALADHANDDGECYPSLRKIEAKTGLSKQGLINAIKRLMDLGLIQKEHRNRNDGGQTSNLYTLTLDGAVNTVYPPCQQQTQSLSTQCTPPVNTVYPINHQDNTPTEPSNKSSYNLYVEQCTEQIINRLNSKLGTRYKSNNKDTIRHIKARLKEGFTLDDFYTVIDKKVLLWGKDIKMQAYLRPETLFGTKFESYLNEVVSQGKILQAQGVLSEAGAKTMSVAQEWIND